MMRADMVVRTELLWQLAAVLNAQRPWAQAAGARADSAALQTALARVQHQLLATSCVLGDE